MDDLEREMLSRKGTRVWVGFAYDQAKEFDYEKGYVYLTRKQCPFDDALEFVLKPVRKEASRDRTS